MLSFLHICRPCGEPESFQTRNLSSYKDSNPPCCPRSANNRVGREKGSYGGLRPQTPLKIKKTKIQTLPVVRVPRTTGREEWGLFAPKPLTRNNVPGPYQFGAAYVGHGTTWAVTIWVRAIIFPREESILQQHRSDYVIGLDVGGTFTDVFFLDQSTGHCAIAKLPSLPGDPATSFINGIARQVDDFSAIATIVHGTTVATNALLQRKLARTGVITTSGFRDVLEMRRRDRPTTWGLDGQFTPVVPRDLRVEIDERMLADGTVHIALQPEQIHKAAEYLLRAGVESVCVAFINAYANPTNEHAALAALREVWPNDYVTASSDILPEIREFERISTATLNACLQPPLAGYLGKLQDALRARNSACDVLIVQSNGGVMTVDNACNTPIRTALSGPAAGVMASAYIAAEAGFPNVITCDMGGTSFDVSVIADGVSRLSAQTSIEFGLVIRSPMIEITTIGAGGGSIAWVDRSGLLQIGPESAGSYPGPACYGQGADRPTVTDANLVTGRINAEKPIGGELTRLDVEAARSVIETHIGRVLGLDVLTAADSIIRVANSRMAGAIRLVSIERGLDPKKFTVMPFGGGGALHVCALLKEVGLQGALVPRYPGINSALGCVIADMRHDFVQTVNLMLDDEGIIGPKMAEMADKGLHLLKKSGTKIDRVTVLFGLDMCYQGQTHTVSVSLPAEYEGGEVCVTRAMIHDAFIAHYTSLYGRPLTGIAIRILNLRVATLGHRPRFDLGLLAPSTERPEPVSMRDVWLQGRWYETVIHDRLALPIGYIVPGPAILEQPDATIFIEPDAEGEVDQFGNLIITGKAG